MTDSEEIKRRRTFAIISHPDAGKTTLTEKLLLYGGAIHLAGSVKARKTSRYAVSDWMEIEKTARHFRHQAPFSIRLQRLPHQHSRYPRACRLFGRYLPYAHGGGQRRHGHRRGKRRGSPNEKTFQSLFRPGHSHFLPLSIKSTISAKILLT